MRLVKCAIEIASSSLVRQFHPQLKLRRPPFRGFQIPIYQRLVQCTKGRAIAAFKTMSALLSSNSHPSLPRLRTNINPTQSLKHGSGYLLNSRGFNFAYAVGILSSDNNSLQQLLSRRPPKSLRPRIGVPVVGLPAASTWPQGDASSLGSAEHVA